MKSVGLDVGSTTLKCVVLDEEGTILYQAYQRHRAKASELCASYLREIDRRFPGEEMYLTVSGSAGLGLAEQLPLPFVQEVYATRIAARHFAPETDVVIELGGEDAKILFLSGGFEMRMNGTCAGGTGAFIDQMSSLMDVTPEELNDLAAHHEKIYAIASRCGVFAKSDIQPLLNQGARREDVAAGILYAVVNQTIAGLAQGREIKGRILYLGGPLTFLPELRHSFDNALGTEGTCPENSLYYVALGAAMAHVDQTCRLAALAERIGGHLPQTAYQRCAPLFEDEEEYRAFLSRHEAASAGLVSLNAPKGEMFLGIDAGSTTVKAVLCDALGNLFHPMYRPNSGNPVPLIREYLMGLYRAYPDITVRAAAVTGYGEELIKSAFHADFGLVETVAHFTAAKHFCPEVDFILDIGGQDIKCFRIAGGAIDSIFLNEACSSGCGSFLQTFAGALGFTAEEFARLGLFATAPVDLGSRCTVFMNSAVKQAQKDGATVADIAAGLSVSVVKNALYKVIRCANADALGKNIVVQGGTFLNDAVLRAFEKEIGREVIRPRTAALMGAYGAALYAMERSHPGDRSHILDAAGLAAFHHETRAVTCGGCGNRCRLTVNSFGDGGTYIAGNRCERPLGGKSGEHLNLYDWKRRQLSAFRENRREEGKRTVGIPMGLNFYELLPFWHAFWTTLGFNVVVSPDSSRDLYRSGQHTIPSDTVCYPAKLMHGHIEWLQGQSPDAIFYPDMSYNVEEGLGNNHYNCPVVAYYPQVLKNNVAELRTVPFICDFVSLHDRREFVRHMTGIVNRYFPDVSRSQIKHASAAAYAAYEGYLAALREEGQAYIRLAREKGLPIIVLCGRPYHVDPEVSHGIDRLICSLSAAVLTEDSVSHLVRPFAVKVMNQWSYHARLYAAARYVASSADPALQLVQLVSFGCGVDAVTTDEVRAIVEKSGKLYTQIKIDEISNMGAIKIRLRSLFSAAHLSEPEKDIKNIQ